jgi:hypothetical protein
MTESGLWWEDAARAESRIGVFDGPDPDLPTRWEIEADEHDTDEHDTDEQGDNR